MEQGTKTALSWEQIQALMVDAYLFQMSTKGSIDFMELGDEPDAGGDELVGEAQNFVIILLGGQVLPGAKKVALTPTKKKKMPTNAHQTKGETEAAK